jgi:hypothetical protein
VIGVRQRGRRHYYLRRQIVYFDEQPGLDAMEGEEAGGLCLGRHPASRFSRSPCPNWRRRGGRL